MPLPRFDSDGVRLVHITTSGDGNGIGSMELGRLFTDEDLLVERPVLTYTRTGPAHPAPVSGTKETDDDWIARTLWEATCVGFGVELGNVVGGSRAMALVCGAAALVWSRRRWSSSGRNG